MAMITKEVSSATEAKEALFVMRMMREGFSYRDDSMETLEDLYYREKYNKIAKFFEANDATECHKSTGLHPISHINFETKGCVANEHFRPSV